MKFQAKMAGCEVKDTEQMTPVKKASQVASQLDERFEGCMWDDPASYAHLSKEELDEWSFMLMDCYHG